MGGLLLDNGGAKNGPIPTWSGKRVKRLEFEVFGNLERGHGAY
jgi:hypothetical protein